LSGKELGRNTVDAVRMIKERKGVLKEAMIVMRRGKGPGHGRKKGKPGKQ
jgi:hypothetical protein